MCPKAGASLGRWMDWLDKAYGKDQWTDEQFDEACDAWQRGEEPEEIKNENTH